MEIAGIHWKPESTSCQFHGKHSQNQKVRLWSPALAPPTRTERTTCMLRKYRHVFDFSSSFSSSSNNEIGRRSAKILSKLEFSTEATQPNHPQSTARILEERDRMNFLLDYNFSITRIR